MGGKRYPADMRRAAVKAWYAGGQTLKGAVAKYKSFVPEGAQLPANLHSFIPDWVNHFEQYGSVQDAPRPGQPPMMPDTEADECIRLLVSGYKKGRATRFFRSVAQALKKSKALAQLAGKYGYGGRSLLRRLKARDPDLHRITLRPHHRLSAATKRQRLAYCQRLLAKGKDALRRYLARVVWIDAKKMYIAPKPHLVWAPHGGSRSSLLVADSRLPGSPLATHKIHYYAAVNEVLGACHFKICSGTSGYAAMAKEDGDLQCYKVGVGAWAPASNVYDPV